MLKYKKLPKIEYVISFEKELNCFYPDLIDNINKDIINYKREKIILRIIISIN